MAVYSLQRISCNQFLMQRDSACWPALRPKEGKMALGVLDKIVMYFLKESRRMFYDFQSSKWQRVNAFVTGHLVHDPIWWGCPTVKLQYKFAAEGHSVDGWDVIPFLGLPQARTYAESFPKNLPRTIRVNPKNVHETHFFEQDQ
jgi:hypothetical protein